MVLLDVQHISKTFPIEGGVLRRQLGSVQALRDVSFHLDQGETLAIVGGSGCGKSTLAKCIAGLLEPDAGDLFWEGKPLLGHSRLERAHLSQMIFQDPYASLNPKLSIETQLREVLGLLRVPVGSVREACIGLLESVGLSADALSHYPFQFSGGQRQRIAIARALAMQPAMLIADEPLSALDVTTQAQILDLFARLRESRRLTFLFITHDLAVAGAFSDRIIVLNEGRVVEEGPTPVVLRRPTDVYTQALLDAVPKIPA